MKKIIIALSFFFAALTVVRAEEVLNGTIAGVSDGALLTLLDEQGKRHKIRLDGIDENQPLSKEAKARLKYLTQASKRVSVSVTSADKDGNKVGRLHATVDLNELLVREGLAKSGKKKTEPLANAERFARENGLGVWKSRNDARPAPETYEAKRDALSADILAKYEQWLSRTNAEIARLLSKLGTGRYTDSDQVDLKGLQDLKTQLEITINVLKMSDLAEKEFEEKMRQLKQEQEEEKRKDFTRAGLQAYLQANGGKMDGKVAQMWKNLDSGINPNDPNNPWAGMSSVATPSYWVARSNGRVHNSSCKFYKVGEGTLTDNPPSGHDCTTCGGKSVKYWITRSNGRVHNRTCKYYKQGSGELTDKPNGRNCQICGGTSSQ